MLNNLFAPTDNKKTKLELIWIGEENRPKLEPRALLEDGLNHYHHYTGAWFNSLEFERFRK